MELIFRSMTPNPGQRPEIDPAVVRRTLRIVGSIFGVGLVLAVFWMSKEVIRVRQMQRVPMEEPAAPTKSRP